MWDISEMLIFIKKWKLQNWDAFKQSKCMQAQVRCEMSCEMVPRCEMAPRYEIVLRCKILLRCFSPLCRVHTCWDGPEMWNYTWASPLRGALFLSIEFIHLKVPPEEEPVNPQDPCRFEVLSVLAWSSLSEDKALVSVIFFNVSDVWDQWSRVVCKHVSSANFITSNWPPK